MFRKDHVDRGKNFFDGYNPDKEIDWRQEYTADGRLVVKYEDGSLRQSIYCHLQKRKMKLDFADHRNGYRIVENAFVRI